MNVVANTLLVLWTLVSIYLTITIGGPVAIDYKFEGGWMLASLVMSWGIIMVPAWILIGVRAAARRIV